MESIKTDEVLIYYQNVRGLRTKTQLLHSSVLTCESDLIIFTETWLNNKFHNSELFDDRFSCYRADRPGDGRGGGVLVAVNNKWTSVNLTRYDIPLEHLLIKLYKGNTTFYISSVYIPPKSTAEIYKLYFDTLDLYADIFASNILIVGDFNIEKITNSNFLRADTNDKRLSVLKNNLSLFNLESFNNVCNSHSKTLDLVLSNYRNVIVEKDLDPLIKEDLYHPALAIAFTCEQNTVNDANNTEKMYNFKHANFELLYRKIRNTNWSFIDNEHDVNSAVEKFYNVIYKIFDISVPLVKQNQNSYPVWFTNEIKCLIKRKNYHLKQIRRKCGDTTYHQKMFSEVRKTLKKLLKKEHGTYIKNIELNVSSNSKFFWNYIKSKKKTELQSCLITDENKVLNDSTSIADSFASYFSSVFDHKHPLNINVLVDNGSDKLFSISDITLEDVLWSIKKLRPKKSCGPDLIPPYILKGCGEIIAEPLLKLFTLSLDTNTFPDKWKEARVCPIYKSGDRRKITNYRPVSILCSPAKIFEQIMYKKLLDFVLIRLCAEQHGFVPRKSTVTNLLILADFVASNLDECLQTDVAYLDMTKAFDRVRHTTILQALCKFGVSYKTCLWFASYLYQRSQYVKYGNGRSKSYTASSGVPQGSNLGPLLFLLVVNVIPSLITSCHCLLFADDVKIFKTVRDTSDCQALQSDLNRLIDWSKKTGLSFNPSKTNIMSYSRRKETILHNYKIDGHVVGRPELVKDLGITFDKKLTFNAHVSNIANDALKNVGFILRNSRDFTQSRTYISLFNAFVRSKMEYASIVWSPYFKNHIKYLESVQTRYLRIVELRTTGIYPKYLPRMDLLNKYHVQSLETRRDISAQLFLYKLFNNIVNCKEILARIEVKTSFPGARNKSIYLTCGKFRTEHYKMSPLVKACSLYNKTVNKNKKLNITAISFNKFKLALSKICM